jgi:cell division septation protein DedD
MFAQSLDAHAEVAPFQRDTMVTAPAQMGAGAADRPWSVQLVSEKSEGQALAAFEHIRKEHQAILAGLQPQITKVELGAKGTYYRVRIGAKTQEAANKLCSALKAAGSSCWIQRN